MAPVRPGPRASLITFVAGSPGSELPPIVVEPTEVDGRVLVDGDLDEVALLALDGERAILARGRHGAPVDPHDTLDIRDAGDAGDGGDGSRRRPDPLPILLLPPATTSATARSPGRIRREVVVGGWRFEVEIEPAARAALRERATRGRAAVGQSGPTEVRAIIPGVIVTVSVTAGDAVVAGQQLLVVEAMKMQNELRAPRDGTVERIAVGAGTKIEVGDLLLVIG